jgi:hypothetical protein
MTMTLKSRPERATQAPPAAASAPPVPAPEPRGAEPRVYADDRLAMLFWACCALLLGVMLFEDLVRALFEL